MKTIKYYWVDADGFERCGEWQGDREDAIEAAIRELNGEPDGDAVVYADVGAGAWRVARADLAPYGAALLAGHHPHEVYSIWCSRADAEEVPEVTVGELVRAAREAAGLTQVQLADRLGWRKQALYAIESGQIRDPGVSRVAAIARAIGVSVDELAEGT